MMGLMKICEVKVNLHSTACTNFANIFYISRLICIQLDKCEVHKSLWTKLLFVKSSAKKRRDLYLHYDVSLLTNVKFSRVNVKILPLSICEFHEFGAEQP